MRLFTGIEPSAEVMQHLAPVLARVKGVPAANLHITTKFIGAWPEERLPEMLAAMNDAESRAAWPHAFPIRVSGLILLSRALCAQVHAGPELAELAKRIDDTLEPLGCPRETRAYNPHLTIARPKHENIGELRHMITSMGNIDFGSFEASGFHLYLSQPGVVQNQRSSVYTKLATWRLAPQLAPQERSQA
jgi:2'-5' RNA ligase